jgi:hypothetical protein
VRWVGHDADVNMAAMDFVDTLAREVPETESLVDEHIRDNDNLLLHLPTADLRRYAIVASRSGSRRFSTGSSH